MQIIQKYQNEQEEDYDLGDDPLSEEVLAETFPPKFKLLDLDKYDGTADPKSHLAIFRTMMQL